ncbi:hypothetical protein EUA93_16120 [Nocardioides oleivorans]|uniref:Uncharacterized protein n=1 Tax=Nocardioides oleivorans TaxID=273676 RepID=A0A4Q2RRQ0_9ACTN|nr:hypothetical protein [Nocardioides oleivorans]RYB91681.1 hypothetical protein EUA93_16120 [Nocardioides oleivorans]
MTHGVSFAADADGRRSTTRAGRSIVADALRPVDPAGALGAEQETAWRSGYVLHFRRLVEAGIADPQAWLAIADAGLDAVRRTMVVVDSAGTERPLESLDTAPASRTLTTLEVVGESAPVTHLEIPYRGRALRGADLLGQLDEWVDRGVLEPSAADALRDVSDHPEWLSLDGRTVAVLGAGAEMGPLAALLRWGATVAAVDLPRPAVWERVQRTARTGAGRLLVPVDSSSPGMQGVDLLAEVPDVSDWLAGLDGRLVLGNYLYADGGTHVRVAAAADLLARRLTTARPDTALAFLATPTDAFAVPREAVEHSTRAYRERSGGAKLVGRPLRWATRGRLLHRAYPPLADPGISDSIVPVQGPNYVLAKRIQRWRATAARRDGQTVSFHVAPSTRTRSVVKNRALAAAFAGAHRFGVEIFEPDTANTLMAALLVHDLSTERAPVTHPWQDEAYAAVHGGLWRAAYEPRSALGLAAALGYASVRS